MKKRKSVLKNQKGFTLIEIIAVLVILGILAAVAVPKYFDMQTQAKNQAAMAAIAEGKARISQAAASYLMTGGGWPGTAYYTGTVLGTDAGDFSLAYTVGTTNITITATGVATAVSGATATSTAKLPGS